MTAAELAASTRQAQGLPEHVEDPAVLARAAAMLLEQPAAEVADAEAS